MLDAMSFEALPDFLDLDPATSNLAALPSYLDLDPWASNLAAWDDFETLDRWDMMEDSRYTFGQSVAVPLALGAMEYARSGSAKWAILLSVLGYIAPLPATTWAVFGRWRLHRIW